MYSKSKNVEKFLDISRHIEKIYKGVWANVEFAFLRMTEFSDELRVVIEETVANIASLITTDILNKSVDIGDVVGTTQENVNRLGLTIIQTICKKMDDTYAQNRPKGIHIRNKSKTRTILTSMGELRLTRRLYGDVKTGKRYFAVDELLNIPKYTRVEPTFQADLMQKAAKSSFGAVSRSINEKLSRQTIYNIVKKNAASVPSPATDLNEQEEPKKKLAHVYIEADEDHIHLQDGNVSEMRLVYVHEGRKKENGRTRLKNPKYFVSGSKDEEKIWEDVSAYIHNQYEMRSTTVHLSGDGAQWIARGKDYFPFFHCRFHLDKFHVVKSITTACGGNQEERRRIFQAIKDRRLSELRRIYDKMVKNRPYSRRSIRDSYTYLSKHLLEISFDKGNLCSAEGHVSHVLSARLSARPCGWSRAGAERIAKLRAFLYNEGDFSRLVPARTNKIIQAPPKKRYNVLNNNKHKIDMGYPMQGSICIQYREIFRRLFAFKDSFYLK